MLIVQNLVKEYKNITAVNDISFSVLPGRIFGLLGPNGAGKTTTIRILLNIIKPTKGKISLGGKPIDINFFNEIGYLPEERGLYKKSRVIDVILYFAELKNMSRSYAKKEAVRWLKRLSIEKYVNNRIIELSKGNQQKVQFITAILHNPSILVLDEPFSGFDPINQQEIKDILIEFAVSGKIIMLSTHQMDTAEKLCADIFLINNGKEVCSGSISQIKKQFGSNNVKIEFEGDLSFIRSFPYVVNVNIYSNYAEVQLEEDIQPSDFLRSIVDKINVTHFSVIEPTLNKIFLDVIKKN